MSCLLLKTFYALLVLSFHRGSVGLKQATEGAEVKCIERERQALLKFKQGFKDDGGMLSTWRDDGNGDCCQWRGIQCNNETGQVEILNLRVSDEEEYTLSGEINPSLVGLQHITYLDLSSNYLITGHIPKFISFFSNLIYLNLSHCHRFLINLEVSHSCNILILNITT
ncbi:hypothetical protein L6164_007735 [Bauhinia variegata]|uniref:Uncharacterized protein n=1 Tax=Bauhinia variegata TaxID=167791 RepID=A0ACB9PDJ3_BAUVA|nr:hypothetical protein L6164_007735 [Bauhinia variegata]